MDEYRQLLRRRIRDFGGPLHFYNDLDWMDADTVEQGSRILDRARRAATESPYAERVGVGLHAELVGVRSAAPE